MSTPPQPEHEPARATRRERAYPNPAARPSGGSANGYGILSLCLAAASFVSAPFLLLISVAGFTPSVLAAAGVMLACIGLSRKDNEPGLAVAGLIVCAVLLGLTLSIAILWTRLVVAPAISDYSALQEVIDDIKRRLMENLVMSSGSGGQALLGILAGALLVGGGLLLRRRQS